MSATREPGRVCVVGACNIDLISYVPRLPAIGETLHGTRFHMGYGGKGANQAVMAAKLGSRVAMVTKLGKDSFGRGTLENFRSFGIDTTHVLETDRAFSGVAPIAVDPQGRNSIIIVTGANDLLAPDEIEAARSTIASSSVLVGQLEIPVEITQRALEIGREEHVRTILNTAPAREGLPDALYRLADVLCPNESEAALLTGIAVDTDAGAERAGRELLRRGAGAVVVTLGERGVLIVDRAGTRRIAAERVQAVDSTGAGDAFVGALASYLAAGRPLDSACENACRIATRSVLKAGTQTSFPSRDELGGIDLP